MTALHRVKAYFGMVPVDDLDAYDGYDAYDDDRRGRPLHDDHEARESRYAHAGGRAERTDRGERADRIDHRADRYEPADFRPRTPRPRDPASLPDAETVGRGTSRGRSWEANTGPNHTSVRGLAGSGSRSSASLASVGASGSSSPTAGGGISSPVGSAAAPATPTTGAASPSGGAGGALAATRGALAVDESHRRATSPVEEPVSPAAPTTTAPAEIVTLRPTSYNEARVIGERYRDGIPVIINLTELDDVAAKRLVDFAAGLAFALRGSIEKVTNRVFLLSPPNVEVSAADRRKLAENTLSAPS